ncbi:MAG: DUF3500 domain-containing protein [Gammaproteobacteria bacterium]|nr:DUF3500 domain-containing protein [Gammaproteobacteria bacterium]
MRRLLQWLGAATTVLVVLVGLAVLNPAAASRVLWPVLASARLDDPFVGVTTDGEIQRGLFHIRATGVSTEPIRDAAATFLASLTPEQRERTMFPVDDLEWRRWANVSGAVRLGVGLLDMDDAQTAAAFDLIAATLSTRGFETSRDIMRLDGHLADLVDNHTRYGEKRYWFTVMGEPSERDPWGWQLDGHHLVVNCFVLGDQVVLTPTFMGSEPTRADTGRFAGTAILEEELAAGLALINALGEEQRAVAIIDPDKPGENALGEQFQDNLVVPYEGIRLDGLDDAQRELALELVGLYTGNLRAGHAEVRLSEVVRHWDDTYFAWVGGTGPDAVFYYRIHSPVIMIEYDHQPLVAMDGPDGPVRNHVHTVVRTPNGNDYGKDLLRQHRLEQPH